jgi:hypothetical protein
MHQLVSTAITRWREHQRLTQGDVLCSAMTMVRLFAQLATWRRGVAKPTPQGGGDAIADAGWRPVWRPAAATGVDRDQASQAAAAAAYNRAPQGGGDAVADAGWRPVWRPAAATGVDRVQASQAAAAAAYNRAPQGGGGQFVMDRTALALIQLEAGWYREAEARDLAVEFLRQLQTKPELWNAEIPSQWIQGKYRAFCVSLGVGVPPPFKDFARAFGLLAPRRRVDKIAYGKRYTFTAYLIPGPGK